MTIHPFAPEDVDPSRFRSMFNPNESASYGSHPCVDLRYRHPLNQGVAEDAEFPVILLRDVRVKIDVKIERTTDKKTGKERKKVTAKAIVTPKPATIESIERNIDPHFRQILFENKSKCRFLMNKPSADSIDTSVFQGLVPPATPIKDPITKEYTADYYPRCLFTELPTKMGELSFNDVHIEDGHAPGVNQAEKLIKMGNLDFQAECVFLELEKIKLSAMPAKVKVNFRGMIVKPGRAPIDMSAGMTSTSSSAPAPAIQFTQAPVATQAHASASSSSPTKEVESAISGASSNGNKNSSRKRKPDTEPENENEKPKKKKIAELFT